MPSSRRRSTFHKLGLVIIDEQHRFGVEQRATLRDKGLRPDVLLMTATPIPRTLALTDYSELEVSKITDLPPGRKPVRTLVKPESRRDEVFDLDSPGAGSRADRPTSSIRSWRNPRRSICDRRRRWRTTCRRKYFRRIELRSCTDA